MPAYNGERYIANSINSVIDQAYQDWELIVVDDGSTDRTREIVLQFQEKDGRIKYIYQQNCGQGRARNTGIRSATGEVIAFLDQDDLWMSNKLELQTGIMSETNVDVIFSDGYLFKDDDIDDESRCFEIQEGRFQHREMLNRLFIINRIPVLTAVVRKKAVEDIGLIDEDLAIKNCDDYDLWIRLAENGASFFGMSEKLARYRLHQNQASNNKARSLKAELAVLEKHRHKVEIEKKEEQKRYRQLCADLVASLVRSNDIDEARRYSYYHLIRGGIRFLTLCQVLTLILYPRKYNLISYLIPRIKERASLRLSKTIDNFRHLLSP
jgi:glycosyltransferase involved in cell wall biosynthesis